MADGTLSYLGAERSPSIELHYPPQELQHELQVYLLWGLPRLHGR